MTSRPGRTLRAALIPLALVFLSVPALAADEGPPAPSNAELLLGAARSVARTLVSQVPVTPGTRVGLRPEPGQGVESDVLDALVMALNERRIECVVLEALPAPGPEPTGAAADTTAKTPGSSGSLADLGAFAKLQAERSQQAARADSLARGDGGTIEPALAPSVMSNGGAAASLAVLTYRVPEARVDYVRVFRGGLFGAERVERRASARVALRLMAPGTEAVRWSATADTTVSDVVLKSEIGSLEDRMRPETHATAPTSSIKKYIEPALVVILVAGLISLFYQNRP